MEPFGHARGLSALSFAADLHNDTLALVKRPTARHGLAPGQKSWPLLSDIDERRSERRHHLGDPTEVNAPGFAAIAALDKQLDRNPVFE